MGPPVIFDKSFFQALRADELLELGFWTEPIPVPILVSEIIADLRLSRPKRAIPEDIVRDLARKMQKLGGHTEPVSVDDLIFSELNGRPIPMQPSMPVRPTRMSRDGRYAYIDSTPVQAMWSRWAGGDFSVNDRATAEVWRSGVSEIDLDRQRENWKPFTHEVLGDPNTIPELIAALDRYMVDPDAQVEITKLGCLIACADVVTMARATFQMLLPSLGLFPERFPYTASVLRIALTYTCAHARGILGHRQSDHLDMEYLYYTPFAAAFISADRLQRSLWLATTTEGMFIEATAMKVDLRRRADMRAEMSREQWREHRLNYGSHPPPFEASPITELWNRYMGPPRPYDPDAMAQRIDDLEPEIRDKIQQFIDWTKGGPEPE